MNEEGKDMIFMCNIGKAASFDSHFRAYIIDVQQPEHIKCSFASSLRCHYLFNAFRICGQLLIKSKYDLSGYL